MRSLSQRSAWQLACAGALLLIAAPGCTRDKSCKSSTLLVKVELDATAATADAFEVSISVDGGPAKLTPLAHQPGAAVGNIEVDFPSGYPHGKSVMVLVTALRGGVPLGAGQAPVTLAAACGDLTLMISAGATPDLAGFDLAGLDLAGLDLAGSDAAPPADGSPGSDGPAVLGDGSTGDLLSSHSDLACTAFTENCFNGVDDDCDGLVDCADPNCAAKAICEPTFVGGAYGATVGGVVGPPPSCPPATQGTTSLYNNFRTAADSCTGCTSNPTGSADVTLYSDNDGAACDLTPQGNPLGDAVWSNGDAGCSGLLNFYPQFGVNADLSNITCSTPTDTPTLPPATNDMTTQTFCNWGTTGGGCGPSMACVPRAGSGNHQCVLLDSPHSCDSDYPLSTSWNTSYSDGRICNDCSNAPIDTSVQFTFWSTNDCTESSEAVYVVEGTATPSNTFNCTPAGDSLPLAFNAQFVNCNPQPYPATGLVTAAGSAKVLCCK